MSKIAKYVVSNFILILFYVFTESEKTNWFYIVSRLKHKCYNLALDIECTRTSSYGYRVMLCPWNKTKRSQHWRWHRGGIQSRVNGLMWYREHPKSKGIVLFAPNNQSSQQFHAYENDFHIFYDVQHFFRNVVVEVHCHRPINCTMIQLANRYDDPGPQQLWDCESVYE